MSTDNTNRDRVLAVLSSCYPNGLTSAAIGKQLPDLDPKQRSNTLYNLKADGIITLDHDTKDYTLRTAPAAYCQNLVTQSEPSAAQTKPTTRGKTPPQAQHHTPATQTEKSTATTGTPPGKKSSFKDDFDAAYQAVERDAIKDALQATRQKLQRREVNQLDLKLEVLADLIYMLDKRVEPILKEIADDLRHLAA